METNGNRIPMPTRMLRDWTDSEKINSLSFQAECFFTRLIMKVDDFGRFSANAKLLRSLLFPIRDGIRDTDISRWLVECQTAGLIAVYQAADKPFLQIGNFNQRSRAAKSKFPAPDDGQMSDRCPTDARQMTGTCPTDDSKCPPSSYSYSYSETKSKNTERENASASEILPFPEQTEATEPMISGLEEIESKRFHDWLEVFEKKPKPHSIEIWIRDLLRMPKETRMEAIENAIRYQAKAIHDPRKFDNRTQKQQKPTEEKPKRYGL